MPHVLREAARRKLQTRLPLMPWYVDKFVNYKLPDSSPNTLLAYVGDYEMFFNWLMAEGLTTATAWRDIPLSVLETLRMDDVTAYRNFLATKEQQNGKQAEGRKLSALRSLFHYLSQIAEDEDFYPLLKRNIMAKLEMKRKLKAEDTAERLAGKLLQEHEILEFIEYVNARYLADVSDNPQAIYNYELNKERDTAIISLFLHSGLRVSELVNLDLQDVDFKEQIVRVYRKGQNDENVKLAVYFRKEAIPYLQAYLELRDLRYKPGRREPACFLALKNGQKVGTRMTKRAIQAMVEKYAQRFGKPYLTVHKLRHSFATDYYLDNDLYKTQKQLGHSSGDTTQIYTHLTDKTMAEAINRRRDAPTSDD